MHDQVFPALADPTRRAILDVLREHSSLTAGAIAARFPAISRPAVSKHLGVLRAAGLVRAEERGRENHYTLDARPLGELQREWLDRFAPIGNAASSSSSAKRRCEADGIEGRTVMITGATSGLGFEAAMALAPLGPRLYLVGRDRERAARTAQTIVQSSGNEDIHVLIADLSSRRQVGELADEFLATGDPLHVLLNNAGAVFGFRRQQSDDGIEMTFALNHLAYFTLTLLLVPRLRDSAPARVVNVTGDAYKDAKGRFDFDNDNAERRYRPIRQYAHSKLANLLFTSELARRLDGSGVTVNAAGPRRTTATRFAHGVHPLAKVAMRLASPVLLSPAAGVAPIVHLCTSPDLDGVTGTYWSGMNRPELTDAAQNDEDAGRLWELSTRLTGVDLPRLSEPLRGGSGTPSVGAPSRIRRSLASVRRPAALVGRAGGSRCTARAAPGSAGGWLMCSVQLQVHGDVAGRGRQVDLRQVEVAADERRLDEGAVRAGDHAELARRRRRRR